MNSYWAACLGFNRDAESGMRITWSKLTKTSAGNEVTSNNMYCGESVPLIIVCVSDFDVKCYWMKRDDEKRATVFSLSIPSLLVKSFSVCITTHIHTTENSLTNRQESRHQKEIFLALYTSYSIEKMLMITTMTKNKDEDDDYWKKERFTESKIRIKGRERKEKKWRTETEKQDLSCLQCNASTLYSFPLPSFNTNFFLAMQSSHSTISPHAHIEIQKSKTRPSSVFVSLPYSVLCFIFLLFYLQIFTTCCYIILWARSTKGTKEYTGFLVRIKSY